MLKTTTLLSLILLLSVAAFTPACASSDGENAPPAKEWDATVFCPRVGAGARATYLAASGGGTYAVLDDGRLAVWGGDVEHLFRDNNTGSNPHEHQCFYPLLVPLVEHAKELILNQNCILKDDSTVSCWDDKSAEYGEWNAQDGHGDFIGWRSNIVSIPGATNIIQLATGDYGSLALQNNGTVLAFRGKYKEPELVNGLASVKAISSGSFGTAMLSDGTVMKWGAGGHTCAVPSASGGYILVLIEAGDPAPIKGLSDVVSTDAECAIHKDGSLSCWDCQSLRLFWSGPDVDESDMVPAKVKGVTDVVGVASMRALNSPSLNVPYALISSGAVMRWGETGSTGNNNDENPPETFATIPDAKQIVAGEHHACVLLNDGSVQCWGGGQIGDGTTEETREKPTVIIW